jgi:opacity protein-like surface antigen
MQRVASFLCSILFLLTLTATAQEGGRMQVSLLGTGFFTNDSTGRQVRQQVSESGGFRVGFRYNLTRWISADVDYGRNRITDRYFTPSLSRVQSDAHQVMGGFVVNLPFLPKFKPYLLAEGGAILFDPTGGRFSAVARAQRQAQGAFAYGGGVDYPIFKYIALRAEYRGLVYSAPDFNIRALNVNAVTHTAQPSAGVVIRF